jgi:hypothetical protein
MTTGDTKDKVQKVREDKRQYIKNEHRHNRRDYWRKEKNGEGVIISGNINE